CGSGSGIQGSSLICPYCLQQQWYTHKPVHVLLTSHIIPMIEGKHPVGCGRVAKADHLLPFAAGWDAGEDMVDGPGPVGFDPAAILFVVWCAGGCTAFIVPNADRAVVPLPFDFIYVSGHDRGLSLVVTSASMMPENSTLPDKSVIAMASGR